MPRVKQWTAEDCERALEWCQRKAADGVISEDQFAFLAGVDPDAVAERLRGSLTAQQWRRLIGALRQRRHQARQEQAAADGSQHKAVECQQCAVLQAQLADMDRMFQREVRGNLELAEAMHAASTGKPADLVRLLKSEITGAAWQALLVAMAANEDSVILTKPAAAAAAEGTQFGTQSADEPPSALSIASEMKSAGASFRTIVKEFQDRGVPTPSGKGQWHPGSVQALLRKAQAA